MKKILVVAPDLNSHGGATTCAKACIEALKCEGITPDIYQYRIKRFVLYNGILKNIIMLFKRRYDYVYDFTNTLTYNSCNYFNYIHFPEYVVEERGKYNKGIWKFYYLPKRLLNPVSKWIIKNSKTDFAANSEFTNKRIFETTGCKIPIIYPPCNFNNFNKSKNNKKKSQIISVGGFTGEKNQLLQLDIARHFPNVCFKICGSATRNPKYLFKVDNAGRELRNVNLHPDILFKDLQVKLSQSLIFLHTSANEPFGISTAEAIFLGCIPVVHNSGGQKEVVPYEELRFDNEEEAILIIKNVLNMTPRQLNNYRRKLKRHIKKYDTKIFKKKMLSYINE